MAGRLRDGHTVLTGMDGSTEASYLAKTVVAKAVNRKFRGGLNSTRPRFNSVQEVFLNEDNSISLEIEEIFRTGNVQGAMAYQSVGPQYDAGVLVSIAGNIFFGKITTQQIQWKIILKDYYDPTFLHFWFVQGANMVYGQNGVDRPFEWNGEDPLATVLPDFGPTPNDPTQNARYTPTGNIMAYSHGYIAVVSDINQIAISDHIYQYGFGNEGAMHVFNDNTGYKGGNFGVPANLGNITGAATIPQSRFRNGQGELVFFTENGAFAVDLSPARELWEDTKTTLVGAGCVAPYSIIPVNNDLWYRRPDGISAYKQSRNDEDTKWTDVPLSREVNNWLSKDSDQLLRYASMAYFDNRILCTVYPRREPNLNGYGDHRYFSGLVALDLDPGSTTSPQVEGFGWDGLWTGPRTTQIVTVDISGRRRCFAFSFDRDNQNKTYELSTYQGKDPNDRAIEGSYTTKKFDFGDTSFDKMLIGGKGIRMTSRGYSKVSVSFRPDDTQCWLPIGKDIGLGCEGCGDPCTPFQAPSTETINLPSPDSYLCLPGSKNLAMYGAEFQFKINLLGDNDVKWFVTEAENKEEEEVSSCGFPCSPVTCCPDYDFSYEWLGGPNKEEMPVAPTIVLSDSSKKVKAIRQPIVMIIEFLSGVDDDVRVRKNGQVMTQPGIQYWDYVDNDWSSFWRATGQPTPLPGGFPELHPITSTNRNWNSSWYAGGSSATQNFIKIKYIGPMSRGDLIEIDVIDNFQSNWRVRPWRATIEYGDGSKETILGGVSSNGTSPSLPSPPRINPAGSPPYQTIAQYAAFLGIPNYYSQGYLNSGPFIQDSYPNGSFLIPI